ncbi:MAG: PKD domain-containing protein [Bacteroidetes bacterium]|nr:PKD domain-containing protein [Bacteroidota bacterium]
MARLRLWTITLLCLPLLVMGQLSVSSTPAISGGQIDLCLPQSSSVSYQASYSGASFDSIIWTLPGAIPNKFNGLGPFSATYSQGGTFASLVQVYSAGAIVSSNSFTVNAGDSIPQVNFASSGNPITFNNDTVFTICTNASNYTFFFQNLSSGYDSYSLDFGDGSATQTGQSWDTTSHQYTAAGLYNVTLNLFNGGCATVSKTIKVFYGNTPSAQISSSSALTGQCLALGSAGATMTFDLSAFSNNPSGTIYKLYFSDDSTTQTFSHPPPASFNHTFNRASCGNLSPNYRNSFFVRFTAENPCGQSAPIVDPITLSSPPTADFIMPFDSCRGVSVPIFNNSDPGANISYDPNVINLSGSNGDYVCDSSTNSVWEISPATFTISQGAAGFRSVLNDPNSWILGTDSIRVRFNQPGIYTVKMIISGSALCDIDSITKTICIDEVSSGNYQVNDSILCTGDVLDLAYLEPIFTSCDTTILNWQVLPPVGWTLDNGSLSDSSLGIRFNNAGNYQLIFEANNNCGSTYDTLAIVVAGQPRLILPSDTSFCGLATLNMANPQRQIFVEDSLGSRNYSWQIIPNSGWSYLGGTNANSFQPIIDFQSFGSYQLILALDNGCFTVYDSLTVEVNPFPVLEIPNDTILCEGANYLWNLNANQGSSPFNYSWQIDGASVLNNTGQIQVNNLWTDTLVHVFVDDIKGCSDSGSFWIRVPQIDIQLSAQSPVCYSDSSQINAAISGGNGNLSFQWLGPNVAFLSDPNVLNPVVDSMGIPGLYILEVSDSLSCLKRDSIFIDEHPFTTVEAGPDTIACDANSLIDLNYAASPLGGTWSGSFVSSTGFFDPLASGPGVHTVYYQYTDANGCSGEDSVNLSLSPAPIALYTLSDSSGCPGLNLSASSTSDPTLGHEWLLNDSLIGTGLSVNFSLGNTSNTSDANYTLKLVVARAGLNCTDTLSRNIVIFPKPLAAISLPDSACAGDTLFLVSASLFKGANLDTLIWSSSSSTVTILDPNSPNTEIAFPDNQSGATNSYQVSLFLRSTDGCVDSISQNIIINPRPVAAFTIPANACGPFTLSPSNNSVGNNLNYSWSISPPQPGTGLNSANPIFNLAASSSDSVQYSLNLFISDGRGCADSLSQNFTLYPLPTAGFSLSNQDSCGPLLVSISNLSTSGQSGMDTSTMSFAWDFGNGQSSNSALPPAQSFINTGNTDTTYVLQLIATNAFGCSDTIVDSVTVRADPNASLIVSSFTACAPFVIDSSVVQAIQWAPNSSYNWQAFDQQGNPIAGTNFSGPKAFNYTIAQAEDSISIQLIVSRIYGCKPDTLETLFYTVQSPEASFGLSDSAGCSPFNLSLSDSSTATLSRQWFVNDSFVSSALNPNLILSNPNALSDSIIEIKLVALASTGCTDTAVRVVHVYGAPIADFSVNLVCEGDTIDFFDNSSSQSSIANWFWDFGDGTSDTLQNPKHFYNTTGPKIISLTVTDDRGCSDTFIDTIGLYPYPVAAIAKMGNCEAQNWCKDQAVTLLDSSTVDSFGMPINQWFWDVDGDGVDDYSTQNPVHVFTTIGTKQVRLIVETAFGCRDTAFATFNIVELPLSSFAFDSIQSCGPHTLNVINSSTGRIDSSRWNVFTLDTAGNRQMMFSDTAFSPNQSFTLQSGYLADTVYYFELISTNCCGSDTLIRTVRMKPYPVANFLPSSRDGCSPFPVTFQIDGLTTGAPDFVVLDYGDGVIDTLFPNWVINTNGDSLRIFGQPTHSYLNPGTGDTIYYPSLKAVNDCGDSTVTDSIIVHPPTVQAFLQASQVSGCEPLNVTFTDFSFGGTSVSWCLDYDTISGSCNQPVAAGSQISTTYTTAGTYVVAQFVNDGCSFDTAYQVITVFPSPIAAFSSTSFVCEGDSVFFTDQSAANGAFLNSYRWFFGDGDSSNLTNPVHIYDTSGTMEVILIVGSANGCPDTVIQNVTIYDSPEVDFGFENACINQQPILFSDSTSVLAGTIIATLWDFGDGNTSTSINPSHSYQSPGLYLVKLIKTSSNGCIDSVQYNVNVFPEPTSNFSFQRLSADSCSVPQLIQFNDLSTDAQGYFWDFDFINNPGLNTSSIANPVFNFSQYGIYDVALITTNQFGCSDTLIRTIPIRPVPNAGFIVDSTIGCQPLSVQFEDTSAYRFNGPGGIVSWFWDFGDGGTSTAQNPLHTYLDQGTFIPSLIVVSDGGCSDTIFGNPIVVHPRPGAAFDMEQLSVRKVRFLNNSTNLDSTTVVNWNFGDGNSSSELEPEHLYNFDLTQGEQNIEVCLILYNSFGCRDTLCQELLLQSLQLNVPSALAPEAITGTDVNVFLPKGHSLVEYHLQIFDRWGNVVFESMALDEEGKPSEAWDGRHYQKGNPLPMGAYTWRIDAVFNDGTVWLGQETRSGKRKTVGSVTIVR